MHSRIAYLFGSGISVPAKMPSTNEITDSILCPSNKCRYSAATYGYGKPQIGDEHYVPSVILFLEAIKKEIGSYYYGHRKKELTYEDLYYAVNRVADSESGEYDDPLIQPFIVKILENYSEVKETLVRNDWTIEKLTRETQDYIRDVVCSLLSNHPQDLSYMKDILDGICNDNRFGNIELFTLNHDTLLEQSLSEIGIKYNNGFGKPVNGVRYFEPNNFSLSDRLKLVKLHGSVNWFRFDDNGKDIVGIPTEKDVWQSKNSIGQLQYPLDGRPMFLAGTFNKMHQYTSGIYADMYHFFYQSLQSTTRLVVSGYSFNDKGINSRLIHWFNSNDKNNMIFIHPNPEQVKNSARPAIARQWDSLQNLGRIRVIQKWFQNVTWDEIRKCTK